MGFSALCMKRPNFLSETEPGGNVLTFCGDLGLKTFLRRLSKTSF